MHLIQSLVSIFIVSSKNSLHFVLQLVQYFAKMIFVVLTQEMIEKILISYLISGGEINAKY